MSGSEDPERWLDALVVGSGFGGLGAALTLAECGARVHLVERLNYPGGCASTFKKDGYRFESGATLFSGLDARGLFGRWIARHGMPVEIEWPDPVVELRTPSFSLTVERERESLIRQLAALGEAPREKLAAFFRRQERTADLLWQILDEFTQGWPPDLGTLLQRAARLPRAAPLLRWMGRPVSALLRQHGLEDHAALRTYLDALCQITVQCSSSEAEAPFALGAMDYYWRGTGHVRGGIGSLAWGMVRAIAAHPEGSVSMADGAKGLRRIEGGWEVRLRSRTRRAKHVILNLLPQDAARLLEGPTPARLAKLSERIEESWSACMLYLVCREPEGAKPSASHLEMVADEDQPFVEGNHVFCSISSRDDADRAPEGSRTLTLSTHLKPSELERLPEAERGPRVAAIQERMLTTFARFAPEWHAGLEHRLPASPPPRAPSSASPPAALATSAASPAAPAGTTTSRSSRAPSPPACTSSATASSPARAPSPPPWAADGWP